MPSSPTAAIISRIFKHETEKVSAQPIVDSPSSTGSLASKTSLTRNSELTKVVRDGCEKNGNWLPFSRSPLEYSVLDGSSKEGFLIFASYVIHGQNAIV